MADQQSQPSSLEQITGVVIDSGCVRVLAPLGALDALALLACAADDPANWDDVALVWPRSTFHADNTEFADGLPLRESDLDEAITALSNVDAWFALDLANQRVSTGGNCPRLRLFRTPADDDDPAEIIVLPPWWELHQRIDPARLRNKRENPAVIPDPRRDVLWGSAMYRFFAEAMIRAIRDGKPWIGEDWEGKPCGRHDLTVGIHRDWLMTPREDLGNGTPRDCQHGGHDWISNLAEGQSFRVRRDEDPIPVPTDLSTYENAPFGRHEMILYFDACRETIDAGWRWLLENEQRTAGPQAENELSGSMGAWLADWLTSPFEGGPPPAEVIRCDRLRVPLVDHGGGHVVDCDCPICEMMADGLFGPSFVGFDGHHLELDDEFAFSMCDTREQWEREQADWKEVSAKIDADIQREKAEKASNDPQLESVWKNTLQTDGGIPGDAHGHLGVAFLVAEMVSALKDATAPQDDIDELNSAFRDYRRAPPTNAISDAATAFKSTLESLSVKHEKLTGRSADLQSRIDELARTSATGDG